jgi:crotonobetainyl-CoA:carnitine CoA-transferase CaiB-like acyl-CoA transferase
MMRAFHDGALAGVRVLDASQMMAGPLCGMRLGDLGAEVIKLEPPERGEWVREHGFANAEIRGETTALLGLNRNKKSITVNLKTPQGREIVHDLVQSCDIFIQNFRVGTADRLGIGYEQLSEVNPRLVYCSISGYGEDGPYKLRPGQDLVIQGYSGSMFSVGRNSDPPLPGALFAADAAAAYQTTIGALAALFARHNTSKGQKVEVNLLASLMDVQIQEITTHLNVGIIPERTTEPLAHAWVNAPYGIYRTADGWVTIAMSPLNTLGEALDNNRLREMKSWSDGVTYRDEVYRIASGILPTKKTADWLAIFDRHKIWAGPVYTYSDLIEDDHVKATNMIAEVEHPTIGNLRMPNVPIRLSDTPASVRTAPPLLGEHTDEVLEQLLGYDRARLSELRQNGVI